MNLQGADFLLGEDNPDHNKKGVKPRLLTKLPH